MRYLFYILIAITICSSAFGQSLAINKANKHYSNLEFKEASVLYESVLKKGKSNPMAERNLAYCYLKLNDMLNAEKWFSKVTKDPSAKTEDILNYAEVLEENNKYDEAKIWFEKYNKLSGTDKRGKSYLESLSHLKDYYVDSANYKVTLLSNLNTPAAEFSPCFYEKGLLYVTERNPGKYSSSTFMWDESHFLDLYYAQLDSLGNVVEGTPHSFNKKMNTKYHEGPVSVNKKEDLIVFTRNNYFHHKVKLSNDGVNKLMIFYSEKKEGKWQDPENFPYNNENYSCGHPALSADGKTMYFVSDMPGSIGGTDIWFSKYDNGNWSKPVNAGNTINTEGNEMFPTLVRDSVLYFSSNGLGGLGGLDIYASAYSNGNLGTPKNVGYPFNSSHDDFGLIYDPVTKTGYFSSNRINKNGGSDDVYTFKPVGFFLNILVIDERTKAPLSTSILKIKMSNSRSLEVKTNEQGKFKMRLEPGMEYQMESIFKSYINGKLTINSPNTNVRKDIDVVIPMKKINYKLEVKVSDKKTGNALESCNLMIYDKLKGNLVYISDVTGLSGMITKRLEGKNFGDKVSLKIESEKNTYLKTTTDFDVELANDSVIKIAIILDKLALGVDVGKVVNINPIYFDLDKSNIRPDAAIELDKIVKAMQDNPSIVIELGSHTDCRAAASYNMALSDKRAKSSASYIVSKGIKKDRIYGKGYGESRLVNNCGCEGSKQSDCTEEEHQKNRRTEFKIVKITN